MQFDVVVQATDAVIYNSSLLHRYLSFDDPTGNGDGFIMLLALHVKSLKSKFPKDKNGYSGISSYSMLLLLIRFLQLAGYLPHLDSAATRKNIE